MSVPILTIDGPSGAGKGTVATRIASIDGLPARATNRYIAGVEANGATGQI